MDRLTNNKRSKKKRKKAPPINEVTVSVTCLNCRKSFKAKIVVRASKTELVCSSLKRHLSSPGRDSCHAFYSKNHMKNGNFHHYLSLSSEDKKHHGHLLLSASINNTNSFFPVDFGLTGTANGPIPENHPGFHHQNLNLQTIYDPNQPQVSQDIIAKNLQPDLTLEHMSDKNPEHPEIHIPYDHETNIDPTLGEGSSVSTQNEIPVTTVPNLISFNEMNPNLSS